LTLPFVTHLRSKFHIDVEWVELSLLDQFEAVAAGKVDAAFCRLRFPMTAWCNARSCLRRRRSWSCLRSRLSDRDLIDPEELALETLPALPDNHQLGALGSDPFP
jgi:LysR family transcriptional regulator, benzoate and cis,cis-muconate-responsive activator of ben and cat genes